MRIELAEDPLSGAVLPELWCDGLPLVAANNYLRARARLAPATRLAKVRRLLPFFAHLHAHGWSFFDFGVRRGGLQLEHFTVALVARCRPREDDDGTARARQPGVLSYATAREIMAEVYRLCRYWAQPDEPSLSEDGEAAPSRGGMAWRTARDRMPQPFVIRIPVGERDPDPDALLPEDVERVWAYLTRERQPAPPTLLLRHPTLAPAAWSEARRRTWQVARARYAGRLAWQRRDALLWALLVVGAFRRAEIPLLAAGDLALHEGRLWAVLRVRRAHQHLGSAKTGGRLVYLGWDPRAHTAWANWSESRAILIERWTRRTGLPDHGMLLVKRDGSPATRRTAAALCDALTTHFGGFERDGLVPGARFDLHPHALRHTVAGILESRGLPVAVRRRHFGHRRATTTLRYGRVSRAQYVALLEEYGARALASAGAAT